MRDILSRWTRFTLALACSFYVLMTASIFVHEVLGHGLAHVLLGSRRITFAINPGFAGWASGGVGGGGWFTLMAGIAMNGIAGLLTLAVLRFRRPRLTPAGLPLFWLATTESGHALGYTIQGLLFRQGDASILQYTLGRGGAVFVATLLGGLMVVLAFWTLSGVAGFVRDHYGSQTPWSFRKAFFASFTIPIALIVVIAPGLPGRTKGTAIAFDAGVLTLLVLVTIWTVRRMPPDTESKGRPISWRVALAWTAGALVTFAVTALWLSEGVTLSLG